MLRFASSLESLGVLDSLQPQPRAPHRPDVGPDGVHVLVDPELLLVLLLGISAAPVRGARAFVQRGDDAAAARDTRELVHHRAEIDRVVERGDAEGDVERFVLRQTAAPLHRRPGSEGMARRAARRTKPRPSPMTASTTRSPTAYSPSSGTARCCEAQLLAAPTLEHAVAGLDVARRAGAGSRRIRVAAKGGLPSRARGSGTGRRPRRSGRRTHVPALFAGELGPTVDLVRSFASIPGASKVECSARHVGVRRKHRLQERQVRSSSNSPRTRRAPDVGKEPRRQQTITADFLRGLPASAW